MARPFTMLVVLRNQLVRADFDGPREPVLRSLTREPAIAESTLAERVEWLANRGGRLAASTVVLTDDVFRQTVELDARALRGLGPADLANAIACEAQLYSGVAAADAAIAWTPRRGDATTRSFDVLEMASTELDDIAQRLRALGSRLRAVRHPAGLPRALDPGAAAGGFLRIERWADVTVTVDGSAMGTVDVVTQRGAKPSTPALAARAAAHVETLVAPGIASTQSFGTVFDLADDDALSRWLVAWAREWVEREDGMRLAPRAKPWTSQRKVAVAAIAVVAVALACWSHRARSIDRRERLGRELVVARAPIDTLERLRTEATTLDAELRSLRGTGLPDARAARAQWRPQVPALLLEALARHRPDGILLTELRVGWKGGRVSGYATDLRGVELLLVLLDEVLTPMEFEVVPQTSRRIASGPIAGLYTFDLALRLGSAPLPMPVADMDGTR